MLKRLIFIRKQHYRPIEYIGSDLYGLRPPTKLNIKEIKDDV